MTEHAGFSNEAHFRKLENMYHAAPCNAYYAPILKVARSVVAAAASSKPTSN